MSSWLVRTLCNRMSRERKVWFYRDYDVFSGGHLIHSQYFSATQLAPGFCANITFSDRSLSDRNRVWLSGGHQRYQIWVPQKDDVFFIAGLDWIYLRQHDFQVLKNPKINLIQHVRHAYPDDPRRPFLKEKAIRVCVAPEVAAAISSTREVNGPVYVVENGLDIDVLPEPTFLKKIASRVTEKIVIVGYKRVAFARELSRKMLAEGIAHQLMVEQIPRDDFMSLLDEATCVIFCPSPTEGFYLPALEAMAKAVLVIVPDVEGNRGFCKDGHNCFFPDYSLKAMFAAVQKAVACDDLLKARMLKSARLQAESCGSKKMLDGYLSILRNVDQIW